jgi:hypothetical protein
MANTETQTTKVLLKNVRFSYANVFTPRAGQEGQEPKYSVSIIISKKDKVGIAAAKAAIEAAKQIGMSKKFGGKAGALKNPLRDGDAERPDDETYLNAYFINASSKDRPGVVSTEKDDFGKLIPITETAEFYSGCYGNVTINFFPYNTNGNKGIGAGLGNLQKTKDGTSLGGRTSASADFGGEDNGTDDDL